MSFIKSFFGVPIAELLGLGKLFLGEFEGELLMLDSLDDSLGFEICTTSEFLEKLMLTYG